MQKELNIIMDLMKDLQDKMQYGEDDFSERLGRKKPDLEIAKVSMEPDDMMGGEDEPESMDEEQDEMMDPMSEEEESPDEKFKKRLMRMRG